MHDLKPGDTKLADALARIAALEAERDEAVSQCITETERLMMLNDDLAGDKLVLQAERDALRRVAEAAERCTDIYSGVAEIEQLRDALAALDKEQM